MEDTHDGVAFASRIASSPPPVLPLPSPAPAPPPHPSFSRLLRIGVAEAQKRYQLAKEAAEHADEVSQHTWSLLKSQSTSCRCAADMRTLVNTGSHLSGCARGQQPPPPPVSESASVAAAAASVRPTAAHALPCFDIDHDLSILAMHSFLSVSPAAATWRMSVQLTNTCAHRCFDRLQLSLAHQRTPDEAARKAGMIACSTHAVKLMPGHSVCIGIDLHASSFPSTIQHIPVVLHLSWHEARQWSMLHPLAQLRLPRWADSHQHALLLRPTSPVEPVTLMQPLISVMDLRHRIDLEVVPVDTATGREIPKAAELQRILKDQLSFLQSSPADPTSDLAATNRDVMLRWLCALREAELSSVGRRSAIDEYLIRPATGTAETIAVHVGDDSTMAVYGPSPAALLRFFSSLVRALAAHGITARLDQSSSQAQCASRALVETMHRRLERDIAAIQPHVHAQIAVGGGGTSHGHATGGGLQARQCLAVLHQQLDSTPLAHEQKGNSN